MIIKSTSEEEVPRLPAMQICVQRRRRVVKRIESQNKAGVRGVIPENKIEKRRSDLAHFGCIWMSYFFKIRLKSTFLCQFCFFKITTSLIICIYSQWKIAAVKDFPSFTRSVVLE